MEGLIKKQKCAAIFRFFNAKCNSPHPHLPNEPRRNGQHLQNYKKKNNKNRGKTTLLSGDFLFAVVPWQPSATFSDVPRAGAHVSYCALFFRIAKHFLLINATPSQVMKNSLKCSLKLKSLRSVK